ncbi:MAG: hypothetical protein AAGK32_18635 [Actinomycetota bacterium]
MGWLERWDERNSRVLEDHNERFDGEHNPHLEHYYFGGRVVLSGMVVLWALIGQAIGWPGGVLVFVLGLAGSTLLVVRLAKAHWSRSG